MMATTGARPRLALVGCGAQMSTVLVPALQLHEVDLVAVCDQDIAQAQVLAARYRIAQTFSDLGELLERVPLDGVCIAAGPQAHPELIAQASAADLAVFVEKPPAPSADAGRALLQRVAGSRRPIMVGLNKRYALAYRALLQLGKQHGGGRPLAISVRCSCGSDWAGLEALNDVGIHLVDLIQFLLGPITLVFARADRQDDGARCYVATLQTRTGSIASLFFSVLDSWQNPSEQVMVQWPQTAAEVVNLRDLYHRRHAASLLDGWDDAVETGAIRAWSANMSFPNVGTSSLALQGYLGATAAFVRSIAFPAAASPSLHDAVRAMEVLEAIHHSALSASPVTLAM